MPIIIISNAITINLIIITLDLQFPTHPTDFQSSMLSAPQQWSCRRFVMKVDEDSCSDGDDDGAGDGDGDSDGGNGDDGSETFKPVPASCPRALVSGCLFYSAPCLASLRQLEGQR